MWFFKKDFVLRWWWYTLCTWVWDTCDEYKDDNVLMFQFSAEENGIFGCTYIQVNYAYLNIPALILCHSFICWIQVWTTGYSFKYVFRKKNSKCYSSMHAQCYLQQSLLHCQDMFHMFNKIIIYQPFQY